VNIPIQVYGSDQSGLVCGYLFEQGSAGRPIGSPEILEWLDRRHAAKGSDFAWLHYTLSHAATEKWLRQHLSLSEAFFEALHEGTRSTRVEYADGTLIAVVNDVLYDFSFDASDISTLWLSIDDRIQGQRAQQTTAVGRQIASIGQGWGIVSLHRRTAGAPAS
jgi:zinc transporter